MYKFSVEKKETNLELGLSRFSVIFNSTTKTTNANRYAKENNIFFQLVQVTETHFKSKRNSKYHITFCFHFCCLCYCLQMHAIDNLE